MGALSIFWMDSSGCWPRARPRTHWREEELLMTSGRRNRAVRAARAELLLSGIVPTACCLVGITNRRSLPGGRISKMPISSVLSRKILAHVSEMRCKFSVEGIPCFSMSSRSFSKSVAVCVSKGIPRGKVACRNYCRQHGCAAGDSKPGDVSEMSLREVRVLLRGHCPAPGRRARSPRAGCEADCWGGRPW